MAVEARTAVGDREHRVHWFAGRVHEVLDDLTGAGVWVATLDAAQTAECVQELLRAADRLQGLALTVLAHAERVEVAETDGATSTGAWLAHHTHTPHGRAHRLVKLARALDRTHPATAAALLAGDLDPDQAQVIVTGLDALPSWVTPKDRARAETHLVAEATRHDARHLQLLARRVLEVIDPDAADADLARRLEAEERAAAQKTFLKLHHDGTGSCHGTFRLPTLHGAMLSKALHALASPARPDPIPRHETEADDPEGTLRPRLTAAVLGDAFAQYIERFPTTALPTTGGLDATIVVTVDLHTLTTGLGAATLDTGAPLSAGEVRRLACTAGIIPAVMDGPSVVLDLGRRRYFNRTQRLALTLRDRGCTVASCDRPAAWCHGHHTIPHAQGGNTTLTNGRLLCPRHHTLAHHPSYQTTDAGNGQIHLKRLRQ